MIFAENDILFARQPIFDAKRKLYGYELLYRGLNPITAVFSDANKATSEVLVNYCSSILNDEDAPKVKIFINLTRKLLLSDYFFPIEPTRVVIEILENSDIDQRLIDRVKYLKTLGYQFAIDDYDFSVQYDPLIPLVDYIKIDLHGASDTELATRLDELAFRVLKQLTNKPAFLAEKVESQQEYDRCKQIGFMLYQGYFLERPQTIYGKKIKNSAETALQIVAQLHQSDLAVDDLCHSISRDTRLSYQILKIINSPLCRLPRKVSSLKEAVIFLGLEQVKKWAVALVLSGNSSQHSELFRILLIRARACELYAASQSYENVESFFTVGLFSGIDAVMMADKGWLIEKLNLATDMYGAILNLTGPKGKVLEHIMALEHSEWIKASHLSDDQQIALFSAHENAISWANQIFEMC